MDVPKELSPSRYIDLQAIGFKIGGMWVTDYGGSWKRWLHRLHLCFVVVVVFLLPILGQALYLAFVATTDEIIGSLNILLTEFFIWLKFCNFMYHRAEFIDLLEHLESDLFQPTQLEHLDIVRRRVWWGRIVAKLFYVACPLVIVGFCLAPIVNGEHRIPTTIDYLVFDINKSPTYEIVYFFHMIYKPTIVIIFVAIQTTPPAMMAATIAQLEMLIFNLENMSLLIERKSVETGCDADQATADLVRDSVRHHRSILTFAGKLEAIFGPQFFIQFFNTSVVICTTGAAIMMIESAKESIAELVWILMYLMHTFTDVYITCAFGNAITTKSVYLTTAAYKSGWLERKASHNSSLLVFMTRTQRPLVLRAGYFFSVSISTYASMMNWTYKAFAIINQTTK